jgi:hypothetical protein
MSTSILTNPPVRAAAEVIAAFVNQPREGADAGRAEAAAQVLGELIGKLKAIGA